MVAVSLAVTQFTVREPLRLPVRVTVKVTGVVVPADPSTTEGKSTATGLMTLPSLPAL